MICRICLNEVTLFKYNPSSTRPYRCFSDDFPLCLSPLLTPLKSHRPLPCSLNTSNYTCTPGPLHWLLLFLELHSLRYPHNFLAPSRSLLKGHQIWGPFPDPLPKAALLTSLSLQPASFFFVACIPAASWPIMSLFTLTPHRNLNSRRAGTLYLFTAGSITLPFPGLKNSSAATYKHRLSGKFFLSWMVHWNLLSIFKRHTRPASPSENLSKPQVWPGHLYSRRM